MEEKAPPEPDTGAKIYPALIEVMKKIGAVAKLGLYEDNRGTKYNFRGIDAVVNACGPALREVGVIPVPTVLDVKRTPGSTNSGGSKMHTVVKVRYAFTAADGSHVDVEVEGEANDSSDKGMGKAMSVAMRIAYLQLFAIPTDDPDPDASHMEGNHTPPMSVALVQYILLVVAFEPIEKLEAVWNLLLAHVPGDARVPENPDGTVWWEQFAMRYRREVEEAHGIEGLNDLWKRLGQFGRTFRVGGTDVGQLIKERGLALKTERENALNEVLQALNDAVSDEELRFVGELVAQHLRHHRITSDDAKAYLETIGVKRDALWQEGAAENRETDTTQADMNEEQLG